MKQKIDKELEERKKSARSIDLSQIDLREFLEREDVQRSLAYDSFALPLFMAKILGKPWTKNHPENSTIISEKYKLVQWIPRHSFGFDYGAGFMRVSVSLHLQNKAKKEDPDLYWARMYFSSYDDSEFSIERSDMDLKKAQAVFAALEKEFENIEEVPSRDMALNIAQITGCSIC